MKIVLHSYIYVNKTYLLLILFFEGLTLTLDRLLVYLHEIVETFCVNADTLREIHHQLHLDEEVIKPISIRVRGTTAMKRQWNMVPGFLK